MNNSRHCSQSSKLINQNYLKRPRLLLASKHDVGIADVPDSCIPISSMTGYGLEGAVVEMERLVRQERSQLTVANTEEVIHRPTPKGIRVEKSGNNLFTVYGRSAERAVALNDLTNMEALQFIQSSLEKLGVSKALKRAGLKKGIPLRSVNSSLNFMKMEISTSD